MVIHHEYAFTFHAMLEILFENEEIVAINKPHGLLVHPTSMAKDADEFAMQRLRDQIGQKVYPAHRLDRKTSGVLLFSKTPATNRILQELFRERQVNKTYEAIVRGFVEPEGHIDYPLTKEGGPKQMATTDYQLIQHYEIPLPFGKFQTSRYSLVELIPHTGRYHQLRKHMAHIFHPILGDRPHGCNKQNRLWKEQFGMTTMLLHASSLAFELPDGQFIHIQANRSREFERVLQVLGAAE